MKSTVEHRKLYPSCHFPAYWLLISEAIVNNIEYILFYVLSLYWTLLLSAILTVSFYQNMNYRKCIKSFHECQSMTHIPWKHKSVRKLNTMHLYARTSCSIKRVQIKSVALFIYDTRFHVNFSLIFLAWPFCIHWLVWRKGGHVLFLNGAHL